MMERHHRVIDDLQHLCCHCAITKEIEMTRQLRTLDLAEARRVIVAGERNAVEMNIPYNIAVVDLSVAVRPKVSTASALLLRR
jgi:hypothetical protein